jgi:arylsulfatase A
LHVSDKFAGKSARGLFGDVIEEIDWSVGQVSDALKRNGLDDNTLVIFASDNGPWLSYGDHAGSAGPLREGKATSFDGGVREPAIFRWPGRIPAGAVCREPAMTIDVLPTIAKLIGAELPRDLVLDGKDIWPLISARPGATSPHEALYFYWNRELQAVRSGRWKLHFDHDYRAQTEGTRSARGGKPGQYRQEKIATSLFDLESDPGETKDVAADHPDIVGRLSALADRARADLGDSLRPPPNKPAGGP